MTRDDSQYIVEIMGHTGGEPAHGFHFLGLTQLLLALAQSLFGSFAGHTSLGLTQLTFDRRPQPRQLALHDVVMRASLHRRHSRFFTDHRRYQDEWQVLSALLQ